MKGYRQMKRALTPPHGLYGDTRTWQEQAASWGEWLSKRVRCIAYARAARARYWEEHRILYGYGKGKVKRMRSIAGGGQA